MKELLIMDDVRSAMDILIETVEKSFVMISEECGGWHHYLGSGKASPLGTALGLAILSYKTTRVNRKVLLGINLLENNSNQDGGFGLKIIKGGNLSLTESTSFISLALVKLLNRVESTGKCKNRIKNIIRGCMNWLIDNKNPAEGWAPRKGYQSRVFSTSIALISLQHVLKTGMFTEPSDPQFGIVSQAMKEAADWLINARNRDGGWGELPNNQKSTAFHTSISIIALSRKGMVQEAGLFERAKTCLLNNWDDTSFWEEFGDAANLTEMYDISLDGYGWSRPIWNHFPTTWTIIALNTMGEEFTRLEIFRGMKWLLKQCQKGCIERPTDSTPPIWAIWDVLICFNIFIITSENKILSSSKYKGILLRGIKSIFKTVRESYGYILLLLYLSIGYIFVLRDLLSIESYILGLLVPISLIILDKIMKLGKK